MPVRKAKKLKSEARFLKKKKRRYPMSGRSVFVIAARKRESPAKNSR
ncbi:MAG: hypothetical protein HY006_03175 [Candidatus Sungbacteria bacterium]|nr:hypothetical protein [Candidatus Sungbacteria bacterium]